MRRFSAVVSFLLIGLTPLCGAQSYPSKPIQLIVNNAPGAGTDLAARLIADRLNKTLGTIIVENRGGGSGMIAMEYVKKAAPDGYTLLAAADGAVTRQVIDPRLTIDVLRDFEPVIAIGSVEFFLVINTDSVPVKDLREFVRLAKERKGGLAYATPGVGAAHHLGMELFKMQAGFEALHVPYKGLALALPDLLAGRVQMTFTGYPAVASQMRKGGTALKILATGSLRRSALLPDVPTFAEGGVPGVETKGGFMLLAPAATPRSIIARINAEANKVLALPEVIADFTKQTIAVEGGTPEELGRQMRSDIERWTRVIKAAGIKPE